MPHAGNFFGCMSVRIYDGSMLDFYFANNLRIDSNSACRASVVLG
jgi:hypothetical protein